MSGGQQNRSMRRIVLPSPYYAGHLALRLDLQKEQPALFTQSVGYPENI